MSPDGRIGLVGTLTVRKADLKRMDAVEAGILWFWDLRPAKPLFRKQ